MMLARNIAGIWIARYKGVAYYTGTQHIAEAIAFALNMNGRPQIFA